MSDRGLATCTFDAVDFVSGDVAVLDERRTSPVTLDRALDHYVTALRRKALSPAYTRRVGESIEAFKHYVADCAAHDALRQDAAALRAYRADPAASQRYRRDIPLEEVDRIFLEAVCDHIRSRPLSRRVNRDTGRREREPVDPYTVKTVLQHAWQAFDWIDSASDSETFGGWELPKKAERLFAVGLTKLMSKPERDRHADGPDQITIPELVAL